MEGFEWKFEESGYIWLLVNELGRVVRPVDLFDLKSMWEDRFDKEALPKGREPTRTREIMAEAIRQMRFQLRHPPEAARLVLASRARWEGADITETKTRPLAEKGHIPLYERFAMMEPSPWGMMGFAEKHGLLGVPTMYEAGGSSQRGDLEPVSAERIGVWVEEVRCMNAIVVAWSIVEVGDVSEAEKLLVTDHPQRRDSTCLFFRGPGGTRQLDLPEAPLHTDLAVIASEYKNGGFLDRYASAESLTPELVMEALLLFIEEHLTKGLRRWIRPSVRLGGSRNKKLTFVVDPENLIGAMWLQVSRVVSGGTFRRCRACGAWLEIKPGVSRRSKLYCSGTCRANRARLRRQAKELHQQGVAVQELSSLMRMSLDETQNLLDE